MQIPLVNVNISTMKLSVTPRQVKKIYPLDTELEERVFHHRETIKAILTKKDPRLMVVVGPCSIRNMAEAIDYGRRLRHLAEELEDKLFIVMRAYYIK